MNVKTPAVLLVSIVVKVDVFAAKSEKLVLGAVALPHVPAPELPPQSPLGTALNW